VRVIRSRLPFPEKNLVIGVAQCLQCESRISSTNYESPKSPIIVISYGMQFLFSSLTLYYYVPILVNIVLVKRSCTVGYRVITGLSVNYIRLQPNKLRLHRRNEVLVIRHGACINRNSKY